MSIVKRFAYSEAADVVEVPASVPLPVAQLVIAPNTYSFGGINYDCSQEGLYIFWTPMVNTQHKVVYSSDIDRLMSSLAWLCVNGRADEGLDLASRTGAAVTSKLRMLCGETSKWAKYLCDSMGLETRICRALTASAPTNYYDGHVMIEVKVNGIWKLYDLANDWTYDDKSLRDALPLTSATAAVPLAVDGYSVEPFSAGAFDVTTWQELTMRVPAEKRAEVERVLQIPGIVHTDSLTYFYMPPGTESRQTWLLSLDATYRVVTKSVWDSMFYPA